MAYKVIVHFELSKVVTYKSVILFNKMKEKYVCKMFIFVWFMEELIEYHFCYVRKVHVRIHTVLT